MTPKPRKTPLKSFPIPETLYRAAKTKAERKGSSLSAEIRKFLERYVKRA